MRISGLGTTSGDVKSYGAIGDGVTDDTAAIQACLDANDSVTLSTPAVFYKTTRPLVMHAGQTLTAESSQKGLGCSDGGSDGIIASASLKGARNITISGVFLQDRASWRTGGAAIKIDAGSDAAIIQITGCSSVGFQDGLVTTGATGSGLMQSTVAGNRWTSAKRDGWNHTGTSTGIQASANYADAPGRYGYFISGLSYSNFASNSCDNAGSDAWHFDASSNPVRGITMTGNGVEQPGGNGIWLEGQSFMIDSPSITGVKAGKSCIYVNGAANVEINAPFLVGGDYGVSVPTPPAHVATPVGNGVVLIAPYFESQSKAPMYDPYGVITNDPNAATPLAAPAQPSVSLPIAPIPMPPQTQTPPPAVADWFSQNWMLVAAGAVVLLLLSDGD